MSKVSVKMLCPSHFDTCIKVNTRRRLQRRERMANSRSRTPRTAGASLSPGGSLVAR